MPNKLCADQKVIACVMPRERCNELTMEAARETLRSGVGVTASVATIYVSIHDAE